jgi:zinc protease
MKYFASFLTTLFLVSGTLAFAQHLPGEESVKKGKLDNGLTYYIVHNELPQQRAEFYLATNVGAIQETPDQDGLAHFLEHMCFNGTKNFPGKGILNYLQSIGASFGGNVNAMTGVEETVYMLTNIPLVNESVVDSCLLILHDYSHFVTCAPEEIDKERGVILEERRSRRNANWRLNEQSRPLLYGDTKYVDCTIIGSEENLKTFKPESLTTFYHTWYRPDMQAVIVVGDVDVAAVEAKIESTWSDVPAAVDPKAKAIIPIPSHETPAIGILTDPEQPSVNIAFYWKSAIESEEGNDTAPYVVEDLVKEIIGSAMRERLTDLAAQPESPFTQAIFTSANICETLDATILIAVPKEGQWAPATAVAYAEAEKLHRFGLTDAEIERAKAEVLSRYESAANKASTRKNAEFVQPLINNFFDNHEYMSPQDKFTLVKSVLPQLPAAMINQVAAQLITDKDLAVMYYGPQKEDVVNPTQEQMAQILSAVKASDIQPNTEEVVSTSFVEGVSLPGSPVKKVKPTVQGATEWTLKNGVKVVLLPTEYEKDKIQLRLIQKGGRDLISAEDLISFEDNLWSVFQMNRGVSRFPAAEVKKMLSGKNVSANAFIGAHTHGVSASSNVKDLETAFQLAYLQFCDPRFDEAEYNQSVQMIQPILGNLDKMPQFQFQKQAYKTLYDESRYPILGEEVLAKASLQTQERVFKSLFRDAAGLVAFLVGDFDPEAVKPLVEQYIGSIPKGRKALKWSDAGDGVLPGVRTNDFNVEMETPKVTVSQVYTLTQPYSAHLDASMDALKYILDMIYTDSLREEEGGTYGAHVSVVAGQDPVSQDLLEVDFETNPESADKLRELAKDGLRTLAGEGPSADFFDKALMNLQKTIPENRLRNSYWLNGLEQWYSYGIDYIKEYEAAVNALTPADVKAAAASLLGSGNFIELIMRPESAKE